MKFRGKEKRKVRYWFKSQRGFWKGLFFRLEKANGH